MTRYIAAALQFEPAWGEKGRNLVHLSALIEEAARQGARLVVAPEMVTTGYIFGDPSELAPLAESIPGPTTLRLGELARRHSLYLVVGLPEVDEERGFYYNSAVLLGPSGRVIGRYRKTHAFPPDTRWAVDGDLGFPVFPTELGHLGIVICMDADYFETVRLLALQGAQVVAFPSNWLGQAPSNVWRARALENGVYLVAADRWGSERGTTFAGGSCVINPRGEVLNYRERGDGLVLAEIDLDQVEARPLARRRPRTYYWLALDSYLWKGEETFPLPPGGAFPVAVFQIPPVDSAETAWSVMEGWVKRWRRELLVSQEREWETGGAVNLEGMRAGVFEHHPIRERGQPPLSTTGGSHENGAPGGAVSNGPGNPPSVERGYPAPPPLFLFPGGLFPVSPDGATEALEKADLLAKELGAYLAFGMTISDGTIDQSQRETDISRTGEFFPGTTLAVLVGPAGERLVVGAVHRDDRPDSPESEKTGGKRGGNPNADSPRRSKREALPPSSVYPVIDLPLARVGLLAGHDPFFPETVRILAKQGADLVLAPLSWGETGETFLWAERAAANEVYMAVANLPAPWAAGRSAIYGDQSRRERQVAKEGAQAVWLTVSTREESFCRRKELLRKLRTQWYGPLLQDRE